MTCESALAFEESQCIFYYERSKAKVLQVIEQEVITEHLEKLVKVSDFSFKNNLTTNPE